MKPPAGPVVRKRAAGKGPRRRPVRGRPKTAGTGEQPAHQRVLLELQVHQEELRQQNDELRRTQLELEVARDRYSDLYEVAPLPYLTLTRAGSVYEVNQTCLSFLGTRRELVVDRPFASFVVPRCRSGLRQLISRATRLPQTEVYHSRMLAGQGEVPVELHMRRSSDHRLYLAIVDLSERERLENERRDLLVAAEVARGASAAKDQFLAALSHELRTPLTPVLAAISGLEPRLARGGLSVSELRDLLSLIRRNLGDEVRLIDDLLDLSRLQYGKLSLDCRNVDLHEIVSESVGLVGPEAERKRLRLTVDLTAERFVVNGDAQRLRQVFTNLLRNAIKFTPGRGAISVRSTSNAERVVVEVVDTGIGIAATDLPALFDRFVQTSAGARAGGLGVGLTIVKGIVEAHNGRVWAESGGPRRGSRFVVELPWTRATAQPSRPEVPLDPPSFEERDPFAQRQRILLVDDHEETAGILAQLLQAQGYDVKVAHTLRAALAAAKEDLDVIVSDIGLPDGSGLDLMKRLRPRRQVPAIAVSGYGRQQDVEASRSAGFARHLVKPVEFPKLLAAIRSLSAQS
jgi:PAS domain S-box-containing protein